MSTCQNMGDYLFVEVSEPYSLNKLIATIHEVAEHCQKENLNKVLVDISKMDGSPPMFDRYRLGLEMVKAWGPRIKVAVIARPGMVNRMTENTAVNRGAKVMAASDVETALDWLEVENHKEKPGTKFDD